MNTAEELTNKERAIRNACELADREVVHACNRITEARRMLSNCGEGIGAILIQQAIAKLTDALAHLPKL